jgi:hypothetical protein
MTVATLKKKYRDVCVKRFVVIARSVLSVKVTMRIAQITTVVILIQIPTPKVAAEAAEMVIITPVVVRLPLLTQELPLLVLKMTTMTKMKITMFSVAA